MPKRTCGDWILTTFLCAILACQAYGSAWGQSSALPAGNAGNLLGLPFKTVNLVNQAPKGVTFPQFAYGHLVQFKHLTELEGTPNVFISSPTGQIEHELSIWPAGTKNLNISSADAGPQQQFVFAGRATRQNGESVNFLALTTLTSPSAKYVGTGAYLIDRLALSDDGSIWTVGRMHRNDPQEASGARWKNYDVLRHYSSTGVLLAHAIPRWGRGVAYVSRSTSGAGVPALQAFDAQDNPLKEFHPALWQSDKNATFAKDVSSQIWLSANSGGVVVYDGASGVLYRYNAATGSLESQEVDMRYSGRFKIDGFAASPDGQLYASMKHIDPTHPFHHGIFELTNASNGLARWERVGFNSASTPGDHATVMGWDGSAIVYRSNTQVNWSEISRASKQP